MLGRKTCHSKEETRSFIGTHPGSERNLLGWLWGRWGLIHRGKKYSRIEKFMENRGHDAFDNIIAPTLVR